MKLSLIVDYVNDNGYYFSADFFGCCKVDIECHHTLIPEVPVRKLIKKDIFKVYE